MKPACPDITCSSHQVLACPLQRARRVAGRALFPATAFLELATAASRSLAEDAPHAILTLQAVAIQAPRVLEQPLAGQLLCTLGPQSLSVASSSQSGSSTQHLAARSQICAAQHPWQRARRSLLLRLGVAVGSVLSRAARATTGRLAPVRDRAAVGAASFAAHPAQADCVLHIGAVPQSLKARCMLSCVLAPS